MKYLAVDEGDIDKYLTEELYWVCKNCPFQEQCKDEYKCNAIQRLAEVSVAVYNSLWQALEENKGGNDDKKKS